MVKIFSGPNSMRDALENECNTFIRETNCIHVNTNVHSSGTQVYITLTYEDNKLVTNDMEILLENK